ncbi:hypothetical protein PC121_g15665 [Phytophthora cactorum]|nr:hypothetical protein PC121_g15665 [Phytophthora cactorum]
MSITTVGPIFNSPHGKTRQWGISLSLFDENDALVHAAGRAPEDIDVPGGYYAAYTTCSGYTGMKVTVSVPTIVQSGKNLGKKNATNALTQAYKDILSKYKNKIKYGYTIEEIAAPQQLAGLPFPMALQTWRDHGYKQQYPLSVQLKLDGLCMLAQLDGNGGVRLATRRLHDIPGFEAVKAALLRMFHESDMTTLTIDGELYPNGISLQTISSIVRSTSISEQVKEKLAFHVFDCFDVNDPQMNFATRYPLLRTFVRSAQSMFVQLTETKRVDDPSQADSFFAETVAKGYEGIGKGKDMGCVVFELETADGKRFCSVPNGTYDYRKDPYKQAVKDFPGKFMAKLAKVLFDNLSKDGVPLRGRIVQIGRDYNFD